MRERAGTHGGLLQTGVDIACRLGQLAPCRHFNGAGAFFNGSIDRARLDDHHAALGSDDTAFESERVHDASAAGQHNASEVSGR